MKDLEHLEVFIIFCYVVSGAFFGFLSAFLAYNKGYKGYYFWTGFFFLIFGFLYVIGLPLSKERVLEEQKQLAALIADEVVLVQKTRSESREGE